MIYFSENMVSKKSRYNPKFYFILNFLNVIKKKGLVQSLLHYHQAFGKTPLPIGGRQHGALLALGSSGSFIWS